MHKTTARKLATAALLVSVSLPLGGCWGVLLGAGATAGVAAAQEGGVQTAVSDTQIRLQITDLWLKQDVDMYRRLSMTVKEGRVLITGNVPTPDARVNAIRLAWQAEGVKQVINEINVDNGEGITGYATDVWITTQMKSKLLVDKYVQSINYTVDTVNGVVYLMGVAQDRKELDRVINHAREISRVRNVVSYVRLRGETPPALQTPDPGGPARGVTQPPQNLTTNTGNAGWTSTTPSAVQAQSDIQPGPEDRKVTQENLLPP